ncbi:MAG TPA: tyrosine-type recombinase/integrase [Gemmataceae bacterium]|nr:tyrosine-type recombinase/integrase [Gemmataceae bacterium]
MVHPDAYGHDYRREARRRVLSDDPDEAVGMALYGALDALLDLLAGHCPRWDCDVCLDADPLVHRVRIDGREYYIGAYGSKESQAAYVQLISRATTGTLRTHADGLTVAEAVNAFRKYATERYGPSSPHLRHFRSALRPVLRLFGHEPVGEFRPPKLKVVLAELAKAHCRPAANRHFVRVRMAFKWMQSEDLLPSGTYEDLCTVSGLAPNQGRPGRRVLPIPEDVLQATLPHMGSVLRTAVEVQLLTAARPGEVLGLRPCDLIRSGRAEVVPGVPLDLGPVWAAPLAAHKNAHRGKPRVLLFGPKAQAVLAPLLAGRESAAYVFSPRQAEAERRAARYLARKTPLSYGNRPGSNRAPAPRRRPGERYTVTAYQRAIKYACDRAFPPPEHLRRARKERVAAWKARLGDAGLAELKAWRKAHRWHPHQLRHLAATRLRAEFGIELARIILGHSSASMTEVYALDNLKAAADVIGRVG